MNRYHSPSKNLIENDSPYRRGHKKKMNAICLTYDRNMEVMRFVLGTYERFWPDHPFLFRVPYNEDYPLRLKEEFGEQIQLVKTRKEIRGTLSALLDGLDENEWIWWCMDDKYLREVIRKRMDRILSLVSETTDPDVWSVMVTRNSYSGTHLVSSIFGMEGEPFLRKKTFHGFFQPQFMRVKVLRKFMIDHQVSDQDYLVPAESGGIMPWIEELMHGPLPMGRKVFLATRPLITFGESMTNGKLTVNCLEDMDAMGFAPPSLPCSATGWFTTLDGEVEQVKASD